MQTRRAHSAATFLSISLAAVSGFGLAGCKSDGSAVTPENRPSEGDGSHVQEQMAAANQPQQERSNEAKMETAAGEAANRQMAEAPPPSPAQQDVAANEAPMSGATPEAPASTKTAAETPTSAKPTVKAEGEPKAEPKPQVTFLNCDNATEISTKTNDNGLVIEELKLGEGEPVKAGAIVTINYHGTLKDGGTLVDTTRGKQPATFPLNKLIKGWQQGVPGMKPGGIRRLIIPYQLAYGETGKPPVIPPKSDLVFIIELIQVVEPSK
ncbi:MAG: FKBP-type peptidyl-prolyl cis-trans isomerase [Phycisphaeraceae bacterium]|nr:FKBP-type peptidyl-prolyl cis-trans isomerase [Phycisphaeraceae bacterium]